MFNLKKETSQIWPKWPRNKTFKTLILNLSEMWRTCYHKKKNKKNKFTKEKALRSEKKRGTRETRKLKNISRLFFCKQERSFSLASRCQMCQRKVVNTKNSRIIKLNEGPTQIYWSYRCSRECITLRVAPFVPQMA